MGVLFIQTHATGSDCTAPFDVLHDVDLTLRDLMDEISKRREWGYVKIKTLSKRVINVEYRGKDTATNEVDDLLDWNNIRISSSGGWGRMDYNVLIDA